MADSKNHEWQTRYAAVLLEFDPNRLTELIAAAETAMFSRLQILAQGSNGADERQAIKDAASALFTIKREVLKPRGLDFDQSKASREASELP